MRFSAGTRAHNYNSVSIRLLCGVLWVSDLIKVDGRFPELVLCLVEISHADFSKVTGMVLVDVCSVMMLATSHTTTTWMLSVLSYTTVASGDMAATRRGNMLALCSLRNHLGSISVRWARPGARGVIDGGLREHSLLSRLGQSGRHLDNLTKELWAIDRSRSRSSRSTMSNSADRQAMQIVWVLARNLGTQQG